MDSLELKPARRAAGTVRLPGSKSISNRVLLLAALASGETEVTGLLDADDTRVMRDALAKLGTEFQGSVVKGVGGPFPVKEADLFLGNAGTAFRPLTAALAFSGGEYRLSGVRRMHERPIGDLVDALRGIGARIDYAGKEGFPPLAIHPGQISLDKPVQVRGDVSSQFLTALLISLPISGRASTIAVQGELISKPYVEITLEQIAAQSPTTAKMIALINEHRIPVDIEALREIHPGLLTFEQWMTGSGKPLVDAYFARIDAT